VLLLKRSAKKSELAACSISSLLLFTGGSQLAEVDAESDASEAAML